MKETAPFYHREQQMADLDRLMRADRPSFVLVYGRRRVGKTSLLQHWAAHSGWPSFYWIAPRSATPDSLRTDLIREFWRWAADPGVDVEAAPRYESWLDVFRAMRRLIGDRRVILIFDEFPWAVESDPSLPSRLQAAWDGLFKDKSRVGLILSGSHVSALEKLLASDAPLFGRMTGKLYVPPFTFVEITPFAPRYSLEKRLAVYAIVGGIPDYLRQWDDRADIMTNVRELFLSDLSPLRNEAEVIVSDVLRRDSPDYASILSAVAHGQHEAGDIGSAALLPSYRVAQVLDTLIDLRLIEKRIRASVPPDRYRLARHARYYLADPFLRFYYRLVEPNRLYLARQNYDPILRRFAEQLRPFVAATFEDLCRLWTEAQGLAGRLPFKPEIVGSDWKGAHFQADVLAVDWRQAKVLIGEAKWGDHPVELADYVSLKERAAKVVARMPLERKRAWEIHYAVFARRGFAPALATTAKADKAQLVTFEQMVRDLEATRVRLIR